MRSITTSLICLAFLTTTIIAEDGRGRPDVVIEPVQVADESVMQVIESEARAILEQAGDPSSGWLDKWGGKSIYLSADGWYLMARELRFWDNSHRAKGVEPYRDNIDQVKSIQDQLSRLGIELIIIYAPTRLQVYPEILSPKVRDALGGYDGDGVHLPTSHDAFIAGMRDAGITVIDPLPIYLANRGEWTGDPTIQWDPTLYVKGDPHWSPWGARLVAELIHEHIEDRDWYRSLPKTDFPTTWGYGDTAAVLNSNDHIAWFAKTHIDETVMTPTETSACVLGDSMVTWMGVRQSFRAQLSDVLGFPVMTVARPRLKPTEPFRLLREKVDEDPHLLLSKKLIVWNLYARDTHRTFDPVDLEPMITRCVQLAASTPDAGAATGGGSDVPAPSASRCRVRATLEAVPAIPDPSQLVEYAICLAPYTYTINEVIDGELEPTRIAVMKFIQIDHELRPEITEVQVGSQRELTLEPFDAHPELDEEQQLLLDDFDIPVYLMIE